MYFERQLILTKFEMPIAKKGSTKKEIKNI